MGNAFKPVARKVKVELTQEEQMAAGREMTHVMDRMAEEKGEMESYKDAHKGRMKMLESELYRFRQMVSTGAEWREVMCIQDPDFERRVVTIVRPDTGEVVENRPMLASEAQTEIDGLEVREISGEVMAMLELVSEQHIKSASQLYEIRDAARDLLGDAYGSRLRPAQLAIKARCAETGRSVLSQAIALGEAVTDGRMDDSWELLILFAAAVELVEGTDFTVEVVADPENAESTEDVGDEAPVKAKRKSRAKQSE